MKLSKREQQTLLLAAVIGMTVLYVYGAYIIGPLWGKLKSLGQDVQTARAEARTLEQLAANEAMIRDQYAELDRTVASLRELLPVQDELPRVIESLSDLASQTRVKIQTIFPQRPLEEEARAGAPADPQEPRVYVRVPIQIDASAGYHQLGAFLDLVERTGKGLRVTNLRITSNDRDFKRHDIRMVILGHFAVSPPDEETRRPVSRRQSASLAR